MSAVRNRYVNRVENEQLVESEKEEGEESSKEANGVSGSPKPSRLRRSSSLTDERPKWVNTIKFHFVYTMPVLSP